MDPIYSSIAHKFGVIDGNFLAKNVDEMDINPPFTIEDDVSVLDAIQTLKNKKIGCLLITDKGGKLNGIFSERDVLTRVILTDIDLKNTPISKVMTPNPHAEPIDTTIAFALHLMSQGGYRHLPLVDDEKNPIGILSVKDIVDFIEGEFVRQLVKSELGSK